VSVADYAGIATLITSTTAGIAGIIVAVRQRGTIRTVDNISAKTDDIHEQVQTPGDESLGETMAHVHEVVCGGKE
jgi:hypothetical protein